VRRQLAAAAARDDRGQPGPGPQAWPGSGRRGRGDGGGMAAAGRAGLRRGPGPPGRRAGARGSTGRSDLAMAPAGRLSFGKPGIRRQLWGLFVLLLLAGATVLVLDEVAQSRARDTLMSLQDDALQRMRRLKAVSDAYGLDVVDTTFRARNTLITWNEGVAVIDAVRASIDSNWEALAVMPRNPRQQQLFAEVGQLRVRADRATAELQDILRAKDQIGRA